jgi:hypothetical protein
MGKIKMDLDTLTRSFIRLLVRQDGLFLFFLNYSHYNGYNHYNDYEDIFSNGERGVAEWD